MAGRVVVCAGQWSCECQPTRMSFHECLLFRFDCLWKLCVCVILAFALICVSLLCVLGCLHRILMCIAVLGMWHDTQVTAIVFWKRFECVFVLVFACVCCLGLCTHLCVFVVPSRLSTPRSDVYCCAGHWITYTGNLDHCLWAFYLFLPWRLRVCVVFYSFGCLLFVLWSVDIPGMSLVLWTAVPWQVTASELFVRCPCGFALALLVVPVWCEVGEPICWSFFVVFQVSYSSLWCAFVCCQSMKIRRSYQVCSVSVGCVVVSWCLWLCCFPPWTHLWLFCVF